MLYSNLVPALGASSWLPLVCKVPSITFASEDFSSVTEKIAPSTFIVVLEYFSR